MNIYTQTKDTRKSKVNVTNQVASLCMTGGEERDPNHNDRQAKERKEKTVPKMQTSSKCS